MVIFTATQPVKSLKLVAPWVPAPVAAVVDRALAFHKSARWPNAQAMRRAVVAALARTGEAPVEAAGSPGDATANTAGVGDATLPASSFPATPLPVGSASNGSTTDGIVSTRKPGTMGLRPVRVGAAIAALALVGVAGFGVVRAVGPRRADAVDPRAATSPPIASEPTSTAPTASTASIATETAQEATPPAPVSLAPASAPPATPAPPPATKAAPHPSAAALVSSRAAPDCRLESYVELVKGEPVTRYRRVCH
jgi:hypothetical protein